MVLPPSTTTEVPVTYDAPSEARNAINSPTSAISKESALLFWLLMGSSRLS